MRVRVSIAYHEAGHAVAAHQLGDYLRYVTVKAKPGHYSGLAKLRRGGPLIGMDEYKLREDRHRWRVEHAVIYAFAGPLAQRRAFPRSNWRYGATGTERMGEIILHGSDHHTASNLIECVYGEGEAAAAFWRYLEVRTSMLIEEHWSTIERVAEALIERQTLTRDDIAEISRRESLRRASKSQYPARR